jgi:hypothetical protein
VVLLAATSSAEAHVEVSDRENNRYIKLTPTADRVRVAYTVYMGQVPGAQARRRLDRDRDGMISDAEAKPFGDELATAIAQGMSITVDGNAVPFRWDQTLVGLGTPATSAGAFSVDLIAWVCVPGGRGEHRLTMLDPYRVPIHGETELRAEETPGVRVTRSAVGEDPRENAVEIKWRGSSHPIAQAPYELTYEVGPDAVPVSGTACNTTAARPTPTSSRYLAAAIAAAIAFAFIIVTTLRRRRD